MLNLNDSGVVDGHWTDPSEAVNPVCPDRTKRPWSRSLVRVRGHWRKMFFFQLWMQLIDGKLKAKLGKLVVAQCGKTPMMMTLCQSVCVVVELCAVLSDTAVVG